MYRSVAVTVVLYMCSVCRNTLYRYTAGTTPQCAAQWCCLRHCTAAGSRLDVCTDSTVSVASDRLDWIMQGLTSHSTHFR